MKGFDIPEPFRQAPLAILLLLASLVALGCSDRGREEMERRLAALERSLGAKSPPTTSAEIHRMQSSFTNIGYTVADIFNTMLDVTNRVRVLEEESWRRTLKEWEDGPQKWVSLDPTSKSYLRNDNSVLPILVSLEAFEPYLDGYRMKLKLGNPYQMTFAGAKLHAKWGPPWTPANSSTNASMQKSNSFNLTEQLPAGRWTLVEAILAPANAEETRNVRVSIEPNQISLLDLPKR